MYVAAANKYRPSGYPSPCGVYQNHYCCESVVTISDDPNERLTIIPELLGVVAGDVVGVLCELLTDLGLQSWCVNISRLLLTSFPDNGMTL